MRITINPYPLVKSLLFLFLPSTAIVLVLLSSSTTNLRPPPPSPPLPPGIRIRPGYGSYDEYVSKQLKKTLNPRLRHLWTTRDWSRKVRVFSSFFGKLKEEGFLSEGSRALCIGARVGQEVVALREVGVLDSVGIDLVPRPPLVVKGDFHAQPFADATFDFEFSNVFDHALYPHKFASEIERTLRPGGICVLHVALHRKGDKFSANDLLSPDALVALFRNSEIVGIRKVDGFGLDTEVVFRKKKEEKKKNVGRKSKIIISPDGKE